MPAFMPVKNCQSVTWNSAGQRCWLHSFWNWHRSRPRRPITGVTHYELRRSSVGHWVKYPNTRVNRGMATAAADLASCQELCAANQSCIWIDWSPTAAEGQRCFIHEFRSVFETQMSAQCVSHYWLYRGNDGHCGKQHANIYLNFELVTMNSLTIYECQYNSPVLGTQRAISL